MRTKILLLSILIGGCAFKPQLQRVAVDHNQLVANSANQVVLLNLLRAREREPLHFTSISKLFGDASISGSMEAGATITDTDTDTRGAAGALTERETVNGIDINAPSVGLSLSGKSSIDVAVFDSQEFYQGITASVPPATLAHYLHQGWPAELFTYLFVRQVDFVANEAAEKDPSLAGAYKKGDIVESLINDADSPTLRPAFAAFVNCFRLTQKPKTVDDTKIVPLARVQDFRLSDVAVLDGDKFDVDELSAKTPDEPRRWIKRKGKTSDVLRLRNLSDARQEFEPGEGDECRNPSATYTIDANFASMGDARDEDEHVGTIATGRYNIGGKSVPVDVQVVLRSVEGVIYFLGEYLRAPETQRYTLFDGQNQPRVPILAVTPAKPPQTFVSTRFRGHRYFVPANLGGRLDTKAGRSSQVFSLLQQLINLQKTAKERPTTQTVRVID